MFIVAFEATRNRQRTIRNRGSIYEIEFLIGEMEPGLRPSGNYMFFSAVPLVQPNSAKETNRFAKMPALKSMKENSPRLPLSSRLCQFLLFS
jgi:hypothetical protein